MVHLVVAADSNSMANTHRCSIRPKAKPQINPECVYCTDLSSRVLRIVLMALRTSLYVKCMLAMALGWSRSRRRYCARASSGSVVGGSGGG